MNPRTTAVLAAVALVLGVFVYFNEFEGERKRQAEADEAAKIHAGLSAGDLDAIELDTLDGVAARFERKNGRWWLVAPFEARAEATSLDAMASALVDLPREGTVAGAPALEGFGLGDDARVVLFETGGRRLGLRLGGTTPVGGHRYVARLAGDEIAYVASYRVNAFNRNLSDLRDRRILDFESGRVSSLRIGWPEGDGTSRFELALSRTAASEEKSPWAIVAPIEAEADPNVVRDLLSDFAYLRAKDFLAARTPEIDAALANPAIDFRWTLEGEAGVEGWLRIGDVVSGGRVVLTSGGELFTVAADRLDDFPRRLVAYRFRQLASFELASARRLELTLLPETEDTAAPQSTPPLHVLATLGAQGWRSADRALDRDAVSGLIRILSSLDADDLVADEMGEAELASLGLAPPRGRLRVEGNADAEGPMEGLASLEFGRRDPARGVFVRRTDRDTVFLIAPEIADALPISAEAWRAGFEVVAPDEDEDEVAVEDEADDDAEGAAPAAGREFGAIE